MNSVIPYCTHTAADSETDVNVLCVLHAAGVFTTAVCVAAAAPVTCGPSAASPAAARGPASACAGGA